MAFHKVCAKQLSNFRKNRNLIFHWILEDNFDFLYRFVSSSCNYVIMQTPKILLSYALREKCPYSELFQSVFSRMRTEYGKIPIISSYSARMLENTNQNNSEYGHFLRNDVGISQSSSTGSIPHKCLDILLTSRVAERLKTQDLRKLGNIGTDDFFNQNRFFDTRAQKLRKNKVSVLVKLCFVFNFSQSILHRIPSIVFVKWYLEKKIYFDILILLF